MTKPGIVAYVLSAVIAIGLIVILGILVERALT